MTTDRLLEPDHWRPLGHVPALDGIRGSAVLAVMIVHFGRDRFNLGLIISLDAFFVLSGFLITTMLLDEWFRNGSINLRHFYVRRGLRLLPGLYAMLTLVVIAGASGLWSFKRAVAEAGAAALYVYPAALARGGASEAILTPLWSLSIEEWFYFSLPPLLTILILRKHSVPRLRVMLWTFGSLYALGAVAKMLVDSPSPSARAIIQFRPEVLMLGSLAAFARQWVLRNPNATRERLLCWVARLGITSLIITCLFGTMYPEYHLQGEGATLEGRRVSSELQALPAPSWVGRLFGILGGPGYLFAILGIAAFIVHITTSDRKSSASKVLSWRVFTVAGLYSYGLYLYHYPIANSIVPRIIPKSLQYDPAKLVWSHLALHIVVSTVLSCIAAYFSVKFVERPAQKFRKRFLPVRQPT